MLESWGWAEQEKAFLYLRLGIGILGILIALACVIIAGCAVGETLVATGVSIAGVLYAAGQIVIILFATYGATLIFDVDFYIAYQIMTFGQCLCSNSKKKDD